MYDCSPSSEHMNSHNIKAENVMTSTQEVKNNITFISHGRVVNTKRVSGDNTLSLLVVEVGELSLPRYVTAIYFAGGTHYNHGVTVVEESKFMLGVGRLTIKQETLLSSWSTFEVALTQALWH